MDIFIDKATGTWGVAEDIVYVTGLDVENDLYILDQMSDSEIIAYGEKWGEK